MPFFGLGLTRSVVVNAWSNGRSSVPQCNLVGLESLISSIKVVLSSCGGFGKVRSVLINLGRGALYIPISKEIISLFQASTCITIGSGTDTSGLIIGYIGYMG